MFAEQTDLNPSNGWCQPTPVSPFWFKLRRNGWNDDRPHGLCGKSSFLAGRKGLAESKSGKSESYGISAQEIDDLRRRLDWLQAELQGPRSAQKKSAHDLLAAETRVRRIARARSGREKFFRAQLFADPAWDILLDLYATHLGGGRVSISSLCVAASVPATTALRWINALEHEGLVIRSNDPTDGRRIFAYLSPAGVEAMDKYFDWLPSDGEVI